MSQDYLRNLPANDYEPTDLLSINDAEEIIRESSKIGTDLLVINDLHFTDKEHTFVGNVASTILEQNPFFFRIEDSNATAVDQTENNPILIRKAGVKVYDFQGNLIPNPGNDKNEFYLAATEIASAIPLSDVLTEVQEV